MLNYMFLKPKMPKLCQKFTCVFLSYLKRIHYRYIYGYVVCVFNMAFLCLLSQAIAQETNLNISENSLATIPEPTIIKMEDLPLEQHYYAPVLSTNPSSVTNSIVHEAVTADSVTHESVIREAEKNSSTIETKHISAKEEHAATQQTILDPVQRALLDIQSSVQNDAPHNAYNDTETLPSISTGSNFLLDDMSIQDSHSQINFTPQINTIPSTNLTPATHSNIVTEREFVEIQRSLKILALRMANSPTFNGTNGSPVLCIEDFINATNDPYLDMEKLETTLRDYAFEKTSLKIISQASINSSPFFNARISIENSGEPTRSKRKNNTYFIRVELFDNNRKIRGYWSETTRDESK